MRIAIVTDTHIRAPEGDNSSPYAVNELANARAAYAVKLLETLDADCVVHLGDVVHPLPGSTAYASAAQEAKRLFAALTAPLHCVPGNHDIGDKPSPGMPAKASGTESIAQYHDQFGESRWCVQCGTTTLIAINSSLINSGLEEEATQRQWLQTTLNDHAGQRLLLFSHYPPFITAPDEADHYDNIAQPGRSDLLDLAADAGVEAILSGHVHHFFFNRYRDMSLWCLSPTSFTRQDYSELFRGAPAAEFGRDDAAKYSVALVTVDATGHKVACLPTFGQVIGDASEPIKPVVLPDWAGLVPHLRHDWHTPIALPYNGPMEEFSRKSARNDYPLLRLIQCGIDTVRVPLADLLNPDSLKRMQEWFTLGIRFQLFTIGAPDSAARRAVADHTALIAGLEILSPSGSVSDQLRSLSTLQTHARVPVTLGRVVSSSNTAPGQPFAHTVSAGYRLTDASEVATAVAANPMDDNQHLLFQLAWEEPVGALQGLLDQFNDQPSTLCINLRLSASNPACANFDDDAIAAKLHAALNLSRAQAFALQCDTFEDVDRGYHPRHGLIDRLGNLRHLAKGVC